MFRALMILTTALVVTATATASADAGPRGKHRFAVFDQQGNKLFDDGKLDGKGCIIGKKAVFNPVTGQLVVVPAVNCVGF